MVQRDACAVDQTEARAGTGNLGNEGSFAEAHLPHALAETLITRQFAHPGLTAGRKLAEGRQIAGGRGHLRLRLSIRREAEKSPGSNKG